MKIVSLFSGAGGLDLGLIKSGHEIIWANDIDKNSCETYRMNIGNHIVYGDITALDLSIIPKSEVIVGGFPCQGFSLANLNRKPEDSRNILYKYFFLLVKQNKPNYFLAENVRGLLSLGKGKVMEQIISDFESAGYRVKYKVFNTANYGVPQSRFRVIIAGTKKGLPKELDFNFPEPTHDKESWITIGEALKGISEPDTQHDLLNHIYSKYKVTNRNFTGHRKTNPDKPSPTILARGKFSIQIIIEE